MSTTSVVTPSSTAVGATQKITKTALISVLTIVAFAIAYAANLGQVSQIIAALVGYALGDAIWFLSTSAVDNSWKIASTNFVIITVLTVAGTFVGQLTGLGLVTQSLGSLVGFIIGDILAALQGQTIPAPPVLPTSMPNA